MNGRTDIRHYQPDKPAQILAGVLPHRLGRSLDRVEREVTLDLQPDTMNAPSTGARTPLPCLKQNGPQQDRLHEPSRQKSPATERNRHEHPLSPPYARGNQTAHPGESLRENGIIAECTANRDIRYFVNAMVDGRRIHRAIGLPAPT